MLKYDEIHNDSIIIQPRNPFAPYHFFVIVYELCRYVLTRHFYQPSEHITLQFQALIQRQYLMTQKNYMRLREISPERKNFRVK